MSLLETALHANFTASFSDNPDRLQAADYEPRMCAVEEEYKVFSTSRLNNSYRAAIMKKVNEIKKLTEQKLLHSAMIPKSECSESLLKEDKNKPSPFPGIVKASSLLKGKDPRLPQLPGFQSASQLMMNKSATIDQVTSRNTTQPQTNKSPTKTQLKLQQQAKSCHKMTAFFSWDNLDDVEDIAKADETVSENENKNDSESESKYNSSHADNGDQSDFHSKNVSSTTAAVGDIQETETIGKEMKSESETSVVKESESKLSLASSSHSSLFTDVVQSDSFLAESENGEDSSKSSVSEKTGNYIFKCVP